VLAETFRNAGARLGRSDQICFGGRFVPRCQPNADKLADPMFLHGDAVEHVRLGDRPFVVGDHNELALVNESVQDFDEATDVRLVEWSIHFIQNTKGTWFNHVDREKECDGCHGPFAAG